MAAKLTDRSQKILEAIIEEYIATAQPVGCLTTHFGGQDSYRKGLPVLR
jgi:hypothetical protein